jgi:pimeloyl-ACP methyl ester carboxylesterase
MTRRSTDGGPRRRRARWTIASLRLFGLLTMVLALSAVGRYAFLALQPEPARAPVEALADADGHFVTVEGARLYLVERGPETGPPVLLIHGLLLSTYEFGPLHTALADAGHRVIAFDRPPFGLSDKSPALDYSVNGQARLVLGLMDQLGLHRATLIGHSAGAVTAAQTALLAPERVTTLVLIDAAFPEGAPPVAEAPLGETLALGDQPILPILIQSRNPFGPWAELELRDFFDDRRIMAFLRANYASLPADASAAKTGRFRQMAGWEAGFHAFGQAINTPLGPSALADLKLPVMLAWGEGDALMPLAIGRTLDDVIPDSTLRIYPGCAHIPWAGCTSSLIADVIAFLRSPAR